MPDFNHVAFGIVLLAVGGFACFGLYKRISRNDGPTRKERVPPVIVDPHIKSDKKDEKKETAVAGGHDNHPKPAMTPIRMLQWAIFWPLAIVGGVAIIVIGAYLLWSPVTGLVDKATGKHTHVASAASAAAPAPAPAVSEDTIAPEPTRASDDEVVNRHVTIRPPGEPIAVSEAPPTGSWITCRQLSPGDGFTADVHLPAFSGINPRTDTDPSHWATADGHTAGRAERYISTDGTTFDMDVVYVHPGHPCPWS